MRIATIEHRDFNVAESARLLADALRDHLDTAVTASEAVALTGLPVEQAHEALAYLAIRNAAHVTFVGDEVAYVFPEVTATIGGTMPSRLRSFGRYVGDLVMSQTAYLMMAVATLGPVFVGITMLATGWTNVDYFSVLAGGTLAFGCTALLFQATVRSLALMLPPLIFGGIALGWERWTTTDLYWLPVVALVAVAMQADVLLHFRDNRPKHSMRLIFWGRGLAEPLADRKKLVELVISLDGIVSIGDLMRFFGWTADEAGERLAEILLEYGGDIAIDRNGRMYLRFPDLAQQSRVEAKPPRPAYEVERKPPGPFEGLNMGWVILVAVVCWFSIVASPLNPSYTAFVEGFDLTLLGPGRIIRATLALLFGIPLLVYLGRLVFNLFDRAEFGERREFLDALEFADRHAKGVLLDPDKFDARTLAQLNATIDEERSVPHAMWVEFQDLQRDAGVDEDVIFEVFDKSEDYEELVSAETQEFVAKTH